VSDPTCSIPGCGHPPLTRGWCNGHYRRWLRTGDVQADVPLKETQSREGHCEGPECDRPIYALRLCKGHYEQPGNGEGLTVIPSKGPLPEVPCDFPDCPNTRKTRPYCESHLRQQKRHGFMWPLGEPRPDLDEVEAVDPRQVLVERQVVRLEARAAARAVEAAEAAQRAAEAFARARIVTGPCAYRGCTHVQEFGRPYCLPHRRQLEEHGFLRPLGTPPGGSAAGKPSCPFRECGRPTIPDEEWCNQHLQQLRTHGQMWVIGTPQPRIHVGLPVSRRDPTCGYPECPGKTGRRSMYCDGHKRRMRLGIEMGPLRHDELT
jgi:hypothetical protein